MAYHCKERILLYSATEQEEALIMWASSSPSFGLYDASSRVFVAYVKHLQH